MDAFALHGPLMQVVWLLSPVPLLWLVLYYAFRLRAQLIRRMYLPICEECEDRWFGFRHCCVHHYPTPASAGDPALEELQRKILATAEKDD